MADPSRASIDRADAARMYAGGQSLRQIAAHYGVTHRAVHRALQRQKVAMRPRGPARELTDTRRQQILAAYRAGTAIEVMKKTLQVSQKMIERVAEEAGEPPRRRGGRRVLNRDQIAMLAGQGWPGDAIAVWVGGSYTQVRAILRELDDDVRDEAGMSGLPADTPTR